MKTVKTWEIHYVCIMEFYDSNTVHTKEHFCKSTSVLDSDQLEMYIEIEQKWASEVNVVLDV